MRCARTAHKETRLRGNDNTKEAALRPPPVFGIWNLIIGIIAPYEQQFLYNTLMNYTQIGTVTNSFPDLGVVAVNLLEPVSLGDTIFFQIEDEYYPQLIEILTIDDEPVDPAPAGANAAIHVHRQIPDGTLVFREE